MLSLLFAASEPSKVPFYIAAAALVVWAVALAGAGLTQPDFPYGLRGQRGVIAISLALALAAILTAILTDP